MLSYGRGAPDHRVVRESRAADPACQHVRACTFPRPVVAPDVTVIAFVTWALASGHVPWMLWPVGSLVMGCSMAGVTVLGHETMHAGTVRGRWAIRIVGWLGFLPSACRRSCGWRGTTACITTTVVNPASIRTCTRRSTSTGPAAVRESWRITSGSGTGG